MMRHKTFFWTVVVIIAALVGFNGTIWLCFTKPTVSGDPLVGDLSRIAYLPNIINTEKTSGNPTDAHLNYWEYDSQKIGFMTIGDSFSQGGGATYYQDWLAQFSGKPVLNLNEIFWYPGIKNRFDPIVHLLNDNFFNEIQPQYLIIETVERLNEYFISPTDWTVSDDAAGYREFLAERKTKTRVPKLEKKGFFNTISFSFVQNMAAFYFTGHDYDEKVYKTRLSRDFFTGKTPDTLVYFHEDLDWAKIAGRKDAEKLNADLNTLARLLRKRNIELIYLPVVDKYDLYFPYIMDNRYPENTYFEEFAALPKDYIFINTKSVLRQLIQTGEKNVFWQDDTHWSWKASRAVARSIVEQTTGVVELK